MSRIGGGGVSFVGGNIPLAAEATVVSGAADSLEGAGAWSGRAHVIRCSQPGPKQS